MRARVRGQCAQTRDDDDRADRHRDANAQGCHHGVRFRVIAVLERVIPVIKHLHDGAADANRQNRGDSEPSQFHRNASVTRSSRTGRSASPYLQGYIVRWAGQMGMP